MRKFMMTFFVFALMFGGFSVTAYGEDCGENNLIDQSVDWVAAFGKKGMDKEQVLARRRAKRMLVCAKREARKAAKEARKAGEDMQRKFGL